MYIKNFRFGQMARFLVLEGVDWDQYPRLLLMHFHFTRDKTTKKKHMQQPSSLIPANLI
jgi:hypothetical protein